MGPGWIKRVTVVVENRYKRPQYGERGYLGEANCGSFITEGGRTEEIGLGRVKQVAAGLRVCQRSLANDIFFPNSLVLGTLTMNDTDVDKTFSHVNCLGTTNNGHILPPFFFFFFLSLSSLLVSYSLMYN